MRFFYYYLFASASLSVLFGITVWLFAKQRKVSTLWSLFCLSVGVFTFGMVLELYAGSLPQALHWLLFSYLGAIMIPILFVHFALVFTDTRNYFILGLGYVIAFLLQGLNVFGRLGTVKPSPPFPYLTKPLFWYPLFFVYFALYSFYGNWRLFRAAEKATGIVKRRIQNVFYGTVIGFCGGSTAFFMVWDIPIFPWGVCLIPIYIVTSSYAIFRHQLMDIQLIIRRTVLYSSVSATSVAIYVSVLIVLTHLLAGYTASTSVYSSAVAAGVITLLFDPLRMRIQQFIDKRFFRTRVDREEKLMRFSNQIVEQQGLEQTTRSLCQALSESLNPKSFAIYSRSEHGAEFKQIYMEGVLLFPAMLPPGARFTDDLAQSGIREMVPLASRGEALGYLLLGEKRSELPYTEEDRVLLKLLANQAALAYERPRIFHEVSSGLVHEIKMPMANITLPAELTIMQIDEMLKQNGSHHEFFAKIQKRMKYIMDQAMLASHRVDALQQMNDSSGSSEVTCELSTVIASSLDDLRDKMSEHAIQIQSIVPDFLPSVQGSAGQIKIVFTNLFKNAIEAMAEIGDRERVLTVKAQLRERQITVEVRDTGLGVPESDRDLIFESHYSTKGEAGSGVGLFLCRQIIKAHRGNLIVGPQEGGATFIIELPIS